MKCGAEGWGEIASLLMLKYPEGKLKSFITMPAIKETMEVVAKKCTMWRPSIPLEKILSYDPKILKKGLEAVPRNSPFSIIKKWTWLFNILSTRITHFTPNSLLFNIHLANA